MLSQVCHHHALVQERLQTGSEVDPEGAYFTRQPRPDFPGKDKDWPKGGKPADARY